MRVNKEHPRYPAYEKEALKLLDEFARERDKIPNEWGHETERGLLAKDQNRRLKEFINKNADIFIDDDEAL